MSKRITSDSSGSSDSDEASSSSSSDSEEAQIVKKKAPVKQPPQKKKATGKAAPVKRKRATKKKKGPSKPKTPYNFWMQKTCPEFKKKHPNLTFGDLSKLMGAHWKTLDAEAKQEFVEMSQKDKTRYASEMANFVPSSDSEKDGPPKKKRKVKQKKDPNAPKRPLNAYMFYSQEMRPKVLAENPEMAKNQKGVLTVIGKEWKKLTPQQKEPYVKQAEEAKVRYTEAIAVYKKQKEPKESDDESPKVKRKPAPKKAAAKKSVAQSPKRPPPPVVQSKDESDDDDSASDKDSSKESASDKESEKSEKNAKSQSDKESEKQDDSDDDSGSQDEPSNKKDPQNEDNDSEESES
eukprot:TRINITY_DN10530_c0_g1_i4.p1 TRINITY_DN10530_c0_g1~~TRINITY_DN10530_c0_g1_i4.p1  ORF type:complete len:349 (-),score=103.86 TRINITY_DN10530_c0_g1_i4:51-1097(-)